AGHIDQSDPRRIAAARRERRADQRQVAGSVVTEHRYGAGILSVRVDCDQVRPAIAVDVPDRREADVGAACAERETIESAARLAVQDGERSPGNAAVEGGAVAGSEICQDR